MKVGIFGGSFDPIHNGHIRLAQYVRENTDLDEVWLMVSPLNPLKPQGYVATDEQRLEMARLAVADIPGVKVSDFEFSLPIPSYTYNTLTKLKEAYPDIDFRLIIGGDNWAHFDSWRNPQEILDEFGVIVYPRPGEEVCDRLSSSPLTLKSPQIMILDGAPRMPVSSTEIRHLLQHQSTPNAQPTTPYVPVADNSSIDHSSSAGYLPVSVLDYIRSNNIYSKSGDCSVGDGADGSAGESGVAAAPVGS